MMGHLTINKMAKWLKIGIPLILVIGAVLAYRYYNKPRKSMESEEAAYQLAASELTAAFMESEEEANKKFLGKILEVSGEVSEIIEEEGSYGLILNGGSDGSVYCAFSDESQMESQMESRTEPGTGSPVEVGQKIKVKGVCSGFLMDVVLNDCVIINR